MNNVLVGCLFCATCPPHDRLLFRGDQRALEVKQEYEYTCQCKFLKQETNFIYPRVRSSIIGENIRL